MARTIAEIIKNPVALTPFMFKKFCGYVECETPIKEEYGFEPLVNGRFSIGTIPFSDAPDGVSRVDLIFAPRSAILGERDDVIEVTFFAGENVKMMFPFSAREFAVLNQINGNNDEEKLFFSLRRFLIDFYKRDGATELERYAGKAV